MPDASRRLICNELTTIEEALAAELPILYAEGAFGEFWAAVYNLEHFLTLKGKLCPPGRKAKS